MRRGTKRRYSNYAPRGVLLRRKAFSFCRVWGYVNGRGKIAEDRTIETNGTELRLRVEGRLGEMMEQAPKNGGGNLAQS
jgi:hypothetical protein